MKKIKLYAIGDSLTAGYPFEEEFSFPSIIGKSMDCKVINLGVNGQSSKEILYRIRLSNIFENEDSDMIEIATILCGSNDFIFEGEVEAKSVMHTLQLASLCRGKKVIPIVISPMLCNASQARESWIDSEFINYEKVNNSIRRYQDMLKESCEDERFNVDFMSLENIYSNYGKFVDGLHPDKRGYEIIAKAIEDKILKIVAKN